MKNISHIILTLVTLALPLAGMSQGRVAYQSYVDSKVESVKSTANNAAKKVDALNGVVVGDSFVIVVTNYDSVTKIPAASFRYKLEDGRYREVWKELDRWHWLFDSWVPSNLYYKAQTDALLAQKADRSWGKYESASGLDSPDGNLWISQKVVISDNLRYSPYVVESGSAIWILETGYSEVKVTTNGFRIYDESTGNTVFEIIKGDLVPVGAHADSIRKSGDTLIVPYKVDAANPPEVVGSTDLKDFEKLPNDKATIKWTGGRGNWVAEVTLAAPLSRYFLRATYLKGTETKIANRSVVRFDNGIEIDGVKYKLGVATLSSGETVMTLTSLGAVSK